MEKNDDAKNGITGGDFTWSEFIINTLKGVSIGIANVIPGVSGGTLAVITGIFERLLNAIKSIDLNAIKMLFRMDLKGFARQIDLGFLAAVATGMAIAIVSVAKLFEYLFAAYPVYIWAFFFGLILPSVYYVGRTVKKWDLVSVVMFVAGTFLAVVLSFLSAGVENPNVLYVFLCGVVSICAMILPGVSGSFVLVLMGNYKLIAIQSVSSMNLGVLLPFAAGCVVGLLAFAHVLNLVMKKFHDVTVALLTGFVLGSLVMIWPWKKTIYLLDAAGQPLVRNGEMIVSKYINIMPESFSTEVALAIGAAVLGMIIICVTEYMASAKPEKK